MRHPRPRHTDGSVGDRAAAALVGAIAGGITASAVLFWPSGGSSDARVVVLKYAIPLGAVIGGLMGLLVGSDKMARYFGIVWGTEEPTTGENIILGIIVLGVLAGAVYLFLYR